MPRKVFHLQIYVFHDIPPSPFFNLIFPIHKGFHLVEGPPSLLMKMCVSEVPAMGVQKPEVVSGIVWNIYFVSLSINHK